ncbi:MAG TPA: histidine triad nucleotide-binding protein [Planctomycetota bacterium]|nr:histidine triad nucleotide-binding protein [Planctomycetota bacterium]
MSDDCIFCRIIAGKIPSTQVYADEHVYAFEDIHPVAKVHTLIVPRKHIGSVNDLNATDAQLLSKIFQAAQQIAKQKNIESTGYRVLTNTGPDAGQTVFHLHYHFLGGERLHPM